MWYTHGVQVRMADGSTFVVRKCRNLLVAQDARDRLASRNPANKYWIVEL